MPKSAKKRSPKSTAAPTTAAKSPLPAITAPEKKNEAGSKQSRVIAMLQSPDRNDCRDDEGNRLAAAFSAWLPCRRGAQTLKLKLSSQKIDGNRVYQIAGGDGGKSDAASPSAVRPERHAARQDRSGSAGPEDNRRRDRAFA